jgi:hypothetical protein
VRANQHAPALSGESLRSPSRWRIEAGERAVSEAYIRRAAIEAR